MKYVILKTALHCFVNPVLYMFFCLSTRLGLTKNGMQIKKKKKEDSSILRILNAHKKVL